jgi:hypothetical protein
MKWIKSYKLFEDIEDEDENDITPDGFKYSWNDIDEALLYLTDLRFKIDNPIEWRDGYDWNYREEAKKRYLADENGKEIKPTRLGQEYKSNIELAKWAVYEMRLKKPLTISGLERSVKDGDYFLTENPEKMIEIYQEIDSFCARFDKSYHSLKVKPDGYYLWLIVASEVSDDFINSEKERELNSKVVSKIENQIYQTLIDKFNTKSYTKKFREDFIGSTLYELKTGIAIKCFNWSSITKGVYNTNSELFDRHVKSILSDFNENGYWKYGQYGYKAEFRELKPEDIIGLEDDSEIKKAKEYIGTKAIIVKFDYNKVVDNIRKEILKNK